MSQNGDILESLKQFIIEQNNIQTDKLIDYINSRVSEVEKTIKSQAEKNEQLEKELEQVKAKNKVLEKQIRKNNIIIFNLGYKSGDLLQFTLNKLNDELKLTTRIPETEINNIYTIGKTHENKPIIIQFVRYLTKQRVLQNCKNLKGSKIRISEILSEEEREDRRILTQHLKEVKEKNLKAHIYGNKLFIESQPYTAAELRKNGNESKEDGNIEDAIEENNHINAEGETGPYINKKEDENGARNKKKMVRTAFTRSQKQQHAQ